MRADREQRLQREREIEAKLMEEMQAAQAESLRVEQERLAEKQVR